MILSMPFIYGMTLPLVFIDIATRIYQAACFPLYGMKMVERRRYTRFDRSKIAHLDRIDRLHCDYCSYANGVVAYVKEVLMQTEYYWCPIRNKIGTDFKEPAHHKDFAAYPDKEKLAEIIRTTPFGDAS